MRNAFDFFISRWRPRQEPSSLLLIRSGKEGVPFRCYDLSWIPGYRVRRLPKWIQPLALFCRNGRLLVRYGLDSVLYRPELKNSPKEIQRNLSLGVEYVCNAEVEGDIAEFGTMHGFSASIISFAMSRFDRRRRPPWKFFLFDSFQGLPVAESEVDKSSPNVRTGVWGPPKIWWGLSKETLRQVCARFLPSERIVVHDGWFKDTLPRIPLETRFSMLHIDCDYHSSTMDVLDFFFSNGLLSEGACLFFDDWNDNRACPQFGERKAWSQLVKKYSILCSDWGYYSWSGRKFLIHSYDKTRSPERKSSSAMPETANA